MKEICIEIEIFVDAYRFNQIRKTKSHSIPYQSFKLNIQLKQNFVKFKFKLSNERFNCEPVIGCCLKKKKIIKNNFMALRISNVIEYSYILVNYILNETEFFFPAFYQTATM